MKSLALDRKSVGPLGFGASVLGNLYSAISDEHAQETLRTAISLGLRLLDTAPHYGFGLSEKRLGATLSGLDPTQQLIVSTKVGRKLAPRPDADLSRARQGFVTPEPYESEFDYTYDGVLRTYEASLRRLRRDRVDLLLAHDLGRLTHGEDHPRRFAEFVDGGYRAMRELRDGGAVGAIGLGVNETQVCEEALAHMDFDVVVLAGRYTLLEQDALDTFLPLCARRGVRVLAGGPYNSGILATGVRGALAVNYNYVAAPPEVVARVSRIESICEAHGVPLAAAALQFPLSHPQVLTVIAGMGTPEQVEQAVDHMRRPLPPALWADLRTAGLLRPDAPVPRDERGCPPLGQWCRFW
jgi:D-threo-aldose 1-dehydrogenase